MGTFTAIAQVMPDTQTRITAQAAAELLGITTKSLYRYAAKGSIPAKKLEGRWVFVREQLLDWLASS